MVIIGLLTLLAVVGVGLSGVWANSASEHLSDEDISVMGMQLSALTIGQLFRARAGRILPSPRDTGLPHRERLIMSGGFSQQATVLPHARKLNEGPSC